MILNPYMGKKKGAFDILEIDANSQETLVAFDKVEVPTIHEGTPMNTTFKVANFNFIMAVCSARKFILPEYYTGWDLNGAGLSNNDAALVPLEEVEFLGVTTFSFLPNIERYRRIKKLACPRATGTINSFRILSENNSILTDKCEIDLRSLTRIESPSQGYGWHIGDATHYVDITGSRFDALEFMAFGKDEVFITGELKLPSCAELATYNVGPMLHMPPTGKNLKIYLPSLKKMPTNNTILFVPSSYSDVGTIDVYIGPDFTTGGFYGLMDNVSFHIPAGSSDTKTHMDSLGLTYTEYEPEV